MPFDGPVLVGIDFTPSCLAALRVGRRLAQERKVPARALHVIDSLVVADLADSLGPAGGGSVADVLSRDAVNAWRTFSGSAFEAVPLEVVVDHRVHGLLDAVVRYSPSLLVLGAFGSRPADVGAGTTATAAVRRGGCDVLLVRDTHEGAFRRILVGVDFSETSLKALRVALEIARDEGASTEVLHVFHGPWHALHYRAPTPEADPRFQVQFRNAVDRRLAVVVGEAASAVGLDASAVRCSTVDDSSARSVLAEHAARSGADLVVIGTRGRSNLRDFLLGSTAESLLREARSSILAVRPDA